MTKMKIYTHEEMLDRVLGAKGTKARDKHEHAMERFKIYTEEEMLDRHIGKRGTRAREHFENEFNAFLAGGNPSPSGDTWFDNQQNMASVREGIDEIDEGKGIAMTLPEIKARLGL